MDRLLHKKINLLIHLAHVDGKFHDAEKDLLRSLLKENNLEESYLEQHQSVSISFESLKEFQNKSELLFWVLRLIHADGELHLAELTFARSIASQLGFTTDVIDYYRNRPITSLLEFEKETRAFLIQRR